MDACGRESNFRVILIVVKNNFVRMTHTLYLTGKKQMKKIVTLAGLVGLLGAMNVVAGNLPGAITITPGAGYYHFAAKRHTSNSWMPNIAIAYNMDERWAVEGMFGVINSDNSNNNSVHAALYTIDGIYRFSRHQYFQPYLIAGIGVLNIKPPANNNSQYQGNVNAGIGTQFFADEVIALRGEVRDLYSTTGGGANDWLVNFGISYLIGGK
jgi:OOP family OmpA-OmpF porin